MEDDGRLVLERLRELAGGPELLAAAECGRDVDLVGGAVRDILRGVNPRELDVVVAEDAPSFAGALAKELYTLAGQDAQQRLETHLHERFRTALVRWDGGEMDIATRRAEHYPTPGALPEVGKGTPEEDLLRRDFTVNAIAVGLNGKRLGQLRCVEHALQDLRERRLRVLHDSSFIDDPTRLLRLARYSARLAFTAEEHTDQLAKQAVAEGTLQTLSGARLGAELRLALGESNLLGTLDELNRLGILKAIHPRLLLDRRLLTDALELLPEDGDPALLALASLIAPLTIITAGDRTAEARMLLERLQFAAGRRDSALTSALALCEVPERLAELKRPSELRGLLIGVPPEGVTLAAAVTKEPGRSNAERWLKEFRHLRLLISGEDLVDGGIQPGPEIGRRLAKTLELRLDGELQDDRDAQLRAALAD